MSDAEQFVFSSRNADRTQEWIMTGGGSEKKLSGKGDFLSENIKISVRSSKSERNHCPVRDFVQ